MPNRNEDRCAPTRHCRHARRCFARSSIARAGTRPGPAGAAAARRPRGRAVRHHRLLGLAHHRRLALPDADAAQGQRRLPAGHRRSAPRRRHVGPGEGRRRRRAMQGVRRGRHHAPPGPAAHHVGRRPHAQDGHRRRHADAPVLLREHAESRGRPSAGRRADVAGVFGRTVGFPGRGQGRSGPGAGAAPRASASCGSSPITCVPVRPRNGVPYGPNTTLTEYFVHLVDGAGRNISP